MSKPLNRLDRIEHVVVLMLENRSFDNMLGYLYDPANKPPFNKKPPPNFDGVSGKNLSNPWQGQNPVPVRPGDVLTNPNPDPGEPYEDVYSQLYNVLPVPTLGDVPPNPPQPPGMQGFVNNYAAQKKKPKDPSVIMSCFTPQSLPVLSSLAHYYGVCDHWHASIPTQTLCNRSFVHAGTSSGFVDNGGGDGILFVNKTPTVFNLLEEEKKSWKIYHGSWLVTTLALLTQEQLWPFKFTHHFAHMSEFKKDAKKKGGLPAYSFIEPIYIDSLIWGAENDMHPEADPFEFFGPSNVERGERLLYEVYTTLRASPNWDKTLLIILFDEHGGCYDHVAPPGAIPPDSVVIPPGEPGGSGFGFNRLGVRVPAVIVSAYTPQQTILNDVFDHTSVLSTVVNRFGLPAGRLGRRQAKAPDVGGALTLSRARRDHPPIPEPHADLGQRLKITAERLAPKSLTALQKRILVGAAKHLATTGTAPLKPSELSQVRTTHEADSALARHEVELLRQK